MISSRVLITGGAGFLGAHLARCFCQEGKSVRLFDQVECPTWAHELGCEYVRGDIREPAALATVLEDRDTVVHAAFASPRQAGKIIEDVNVNGTRHLCVGAVARGARRFILISSTIVLKPRRVHPFFANSPLSRLDLYRTARIEAEQIVTEYGKRGLSSAIIRPKTFLGPGWVGAFALIFEWIRSGGAVPVLGNGQNRYQLLDVRDMAEGVRLLVNSDAQGVFYFGARNLCTVQEDLQALLDYAQTGARLRFIPGRLARVTLRSIELAGLIPLSEWHDLSARGEDSLVDISRAEQELGWCPQRSNAQALVDAYSWYGASLTSTKTVQTTHPVPLAHRALKEIVGLFWR